MISHEILQIGHPCLRNKARALTLEEILSDDIQELIILMQETMREAPGVGLAAPQIGFSLQILVAEDLPEYTKNAPSQELIEKERYPFKFHVLINPKITEQQLEIAEFYEGCLSVSGFIGIVPRYLAITVEALNEKAEPVTIKARGWYARILQHEIDHLNGVLCTDRMKIETLSTIDNYVQLKLPKSS